jgi:methylmalonyl-CoA/ethylmalonyl-CoA epimerase
LRRAKIAPSKIAASEAMNLKFKHLGVAVPDLGKALPVYRDVLGYSLASGPFDDPIQKVSVCFLTSAQEGPELELISPLTADSPVRKILSSGGGAYHLCYETAHFDDAIAELSAKGCVVMSEPVPAVAFGGRRIVWLYMPTRQLLELVEAE